MKAKKAFKMIDDLYEQKSDNNYFIDFAPFDFPNENYSELEEYLNVHYKKDFAKKIKFIAFAVIYHYPASIFLEDDIENPIYPNLINRDLRNIGLEVLAAIIDKMILENYIGLNILFKNNKTTTLLRIEDGYDSYFFNLPDKEKDVIQSLVDHQGLFLRKIEE